jgi:hypothetical protein
MIVNYHQRQQAVMRVLAGLLCVGFFVGCENSTLVPTVPSGSSPVILSLIVTPVDINIDMQTPSGGVYSLSVSVQASVTDPQGDGDIREASYRLSAPGASQPLAAGALTGTVVRPGTIAFSASIPFSLTRAQTGAYLLEVFAVDRSGFSSSILLQQILVRKNNTPPVISLPGVREVARHGADSIQFAVTIAASDSDGLNNIQSVTARALLARDSSAMQMYDDGLRSHGDGVAGDGVFSLFTWVIPTGNPQDVVFEFRATDRDGGQSNIVRRPVANSAPRFVSLAVPSTIQRPSTGSNLVTFAATVEDPNGLADIDSVYFRNMSSASPTVILMYDDGNLTAHGDSVASDGTYARTLSIDATTTPGTKEFRFTVVDRAGARSEATRNITIN